MNQQRHGWAGRVFLIAMLLLSACSSPNTLPEFSKFEPRTPLIFTANSLDSTDDRLELSFSISDAEDRPEQLELSVLASEPERIKEIQLECVLENCIFRAEVDRRRPATVSLTLSLLDRRGGRASSSFSVKIEPNFLGEASLVALKAGIDEAVAGEFLALSPNLFPQAATWLLDETLLLDKDIHLLGPGADKLTLDAQLNQRHFQIPEGVSASLASMTLSRGKASNDGGQGDFEPLGGAIFNAGQLELRELIIKQSEATKGGGVYNFGPEALLLIHDSLLGGADESFANHASRSGGALFNDQGRLELYASTLSFNTSTDRGGAVYNLGKTAYMLADKTTFAHNVSADGGAIKNEDGYLRIQNGSLIKNNLATLVEGGGIFNTNSTVEIIDSDVIANAALEGAGGGIYSFGPEADVRIEGARIADNFALSGGGIYHEVGSGPLNIKATTVTANRAEAFGGGIFTGGLTQLSSDSSVFANLADSNKDEIGYGGGMFVVGEDISGISQTVIVNNLPDNFAQPIPGDVALFAAFGLKSIELTRDGE